MRSHKEMTDAVLRRRDDYMQRQKRRQKALTVVCFLCLLTATAVGTGLALPRTLPDGSVSAPPTSEAVTVAMESRLYLASGQQETLLQEGLSLPAAFRLSVKDIRNLSEEEIESVYTIEQEAAENVVYEHADTIAHAGTLRRENVIVSLVRLGTFELEIDDPRKVAFISGRTASEYGRVEFFYHYPDIPKDEYGPYSDNEMTLSGEYYQILVRQQQSGTGRLEINWRPDTLLYDTLDRNPDLPLSTFRDTFSLMVEYNDGSLEEHVVEIAFDDDGNATPCYVCKQEVPLSEEKQ
ncbi:MAG: hypothetical protein IJO76_00025 [Clostridia bacterium]|nr:hypothetical protein [Clostridia bacterium]